MCTGLRVAAETRDEGEIEVENVLQPLDGGGGLVGEDFDEFWSCEITGGFEGIVVELLYAVLDAEGDLRAC